MIIVGGGAAGLSAGLWCDELGLKALVLEREKEFGGQLLWTHNQVENYLGAIAENGRDLFSIFLKQVESREFSRRLQAQVEEIDVREKIVKLADGRSIAAKGIIVATGVRRRKLDVQSESGFQLKGILRSGKLDKDNVEGKTVAVVGGGDAALENALILSETAVSVYLIHRRAEFRARKEFIDQVEKKDNIEIHYKCVVKSIKGSTEIEFVELMNVSSNESRMLEAQAILVRIGVQPNSELLKGKLELDENGYIKINDVCQTNFPGVYAIGDVSNPVSPTVSSAVGSGATAVKHFRAWLSA